jgi:hypothetical protein
MSRSGTPVVGNDSQVHFLPVTTLFNLGAHILGVSNYTSLNAFNNIPGRDTCVSTIKDLMIQLILLRLPLVENAFHYG